MSHNYSPLLIALFCISTTGSNFSRASFREGEEDAYKHVKSFLRDPRNQEGKP